MNKKEVIFFAHSKECKGTVWRATLAEKGGFVPNGLNTLSQKEAKELASKLGYKGATIKLI